MAYMGATLVDEKRGFLGNENGLIVEDSPSAYVPPRRRGVCRRKHPLWNLVKVAATIGSIGMLSYSVLKYSDSKYLFGKHFLVSLESPSSNILASPLGMPGQPPSPRPQAPDFCDSPQCIHAASEILNNLDPNYEDVDPCTNFDQYVCGGWRELHDMRSDQGSIFAGTIMAENSETKLRHILEQQDAPDASDEENFKKLKAAYDACLDESTVRSRGSKPLDEMLAGLQDIYPTKGGLVSGSQDHLTGALLYLMASGVEALVSSGITVS
jgi:hypothetical protein